MTTFDYLVTCPEEVKEVLRAELHSYGATQLKDGFRSVYFTATDEVAYRIHLSCGTGSQIMRVVRRCAGASEKMVTSQAKRVKWHQVFAPQRSYRIDGVCGDRGPQAMTSNQISKAVRLGLEDAFEYHGHPVPQVDLKDPDVVIFAYIYKAKLMLSVQTTGKGLHKRGYRSMSQHPAPVKETLANAMLRLAGYDGSQTLWDPMCGSGTLAIEAAYLALGKAAMIHRKKGEFALEKLCFFDKDLWRATQEQLRLQKAENLSAPIVAGDICPDYVADARQNAVAARVEKYLDFRTESIFDAVPPEQAGILMSNLPYGERVDFEGGESWQDFYMRLGHFLKHKCAGWQVFLLVDDRSPWKSIGLKPTRKWNLKNGALPVKLVHIDVYSGRRT
ncbi:MAG: THUMP domain-containing protein [Zetaproteobacteria bacterium]|nr:THUMP domain-containing protein [Zetaproteobacteria bacterium]